MVIGGGHFWGQARIPLYYSIKWMLFLFVFKASAFQPDINGTWIHRQLNGNYGNYGNDGNDGINKKIPILPIIPVTHVTPT